MDRKMEEKFNFDDWVRSFNVQRLQDAHTLSSSASSQAAAAGSASSAVATAAAGSAVLGDAHPLAAHHHHHHHPHHALYVQGSTHSSGGSVSSAGGASPTSPLRPGKEEDCSLHGRSSTEDPQQGVEDDDSQDAASSRAQYVSANCVVFTHYQGDAASVVDEHFNRALDKSATHTKESSPMTARNFPASFWNSQHYAGASASHHGASAADLYSEHYHPGDAWYQYSQHHRAVHDYHHHNMAAQYGGLLLPGSRLHMSSHAPCKAMDWQHPSIESPYSSYPTMSGLEAQVQDSSKDLYWF
ncbi:protein vestigial isoform X2 [Sitophilus oryzae]|uniref:Protein vestigial isoform X2 n=1 Tax=Sitophilus oryzae TaxID=7048 RepID=A0A6J2Y2K5_SITOR|nr:protein vestigial isoform X2 [Sitophilus oryzae]